MLLLFCPAFSQNSVSLDDVKKEADRLFDDDEFTKAYKLYAQLVSNFPKDVEYNYRLGVCMIYSEPDKKKCIPYLKNAVNSGENAPKDALFYLGKAYHINYLFDEAIKNYKAYKQVAPASRQKKLQVDREITACNNGKHLLSHMTDLVVLSKKQLNEADYFRSYDVKSIGGKLLVKPEEFKTATDKKKKDKSIVFLPKGSNVVYYSSYGENTDSGRDLYTVARLPNGTFGKPEKVKGINTEYDEDYPFLHPDGKTLYFASKGYNSMGGYDIFKTVYNEETGTWSAPVNLEFPVNSPDDDFLFVTDSLESTASFSTGRQSPPGKIDVLKINTERKPIDVLVLKGKVVPENGAQSVKSVITVKNADLQMPVGTFSADDDGGYSMELPNGANLVFTVETPGLKTQSENVALPFAQTSKPYRQTVGYEKGELKITNYFDVSGDDSYLQYIKQIEKKARLDVNDGENKVKPPVVVSQGTAAVANNNKPEVVKETSISKSNTSKPTLDNEQLATIARQDAQESGQEAAQLEKDAKDAYEVGRSQKAGADQKLAEADKALANAETLSGDEKKQAIETANTQKAAALADQAVAEKVLALARSLESDAQNKKKEASLNKDYAQELEKAISNKNNAPSLAKLEELQKQIAEVSGKKTESSEAMNTLKADLEEKEKQLASAEKTSSTIKTNLEDVRSAITAKEAELAETRKKSAKQEITTQIESLKTEQAEKEKQLADKDAEIKKINEELASLKNEQEIATKIKTEDIAVNNTPEPVTSNNKAIEVREPANNAPAAAQKITSKTLQEKYRDKVSISDPKSKAAVEASTTQLKTFNGEIDQALAKDRADLAKAKTPAAKQQISTEIKQLEASKKQNLQFIASNNKLINDLNKPQPVVVNGLNPVVAQTPADAVKSLDQLNAQLKVNENDNFDYNGYQDPQAQILKVEADAKINDAIAQQKKLMETIAASKAEIGNSSPNVSAGSVSSLDKEAEDLQAKAAGLRTTAAGKQGAEKDKLLTEAKSLEEQANGKLLESSVITGKLTETSFSTNSDNIQGLLAEKRSTGADLETARTLNEEASTAFRQAQDIRREAETLGTNGARLGSMSNAEEKEAEAIARQQQAIDLLKKANPDFVLKTPPAEKTSTPDLNSQLEAVNKAVADLVTVKTESYQKLYEANAAEYERLQSAIKSKQSALDNTPSLKTEFISVNNKGESAKTLKAQAENASTPNDKLNGLMAAAKKQNEALRQAGALNAALEKTQAPAQPTVSEQIANAANNDNTANTRTTAAETRATPSAEPKPANTNAAISAAAPLLEQLSKKDTTASEVLDYFSSNTPGLKNQNADNLLKNSLAQLRTAATEEKAVDAEIEASKAMTSNDPAELKSKSDDLLAESEQLNSKAQEARTEASSKTGGEKETLLSRAKGLEKEAQDKTLQAAVISAQASNIDYQTNAAAITELFGKLKTDNPSRYAELGQRNSELLTIRAQAQQLRGEANAMDNPAARLGALSNAEEKETELSQKQNQLITELKKQYPDYAVKPLDNVGTTNGEVSPALTQRKKAATEKQYSELTNLTNAFSLEYESSKNGIPKNLDAAKQNIRKQAEALNAESKRLLIQASQEKDPAKKTKLLTIAAKSGNAALDELGKILPATPAARETQPAVAASNNNNRNTVAAENTAPARTAPTPRNTNARGAVRVDGLEVIAGNAYNANRPIPLNAKMEDGLVFRVQIGAFKIQLPNDAFRGLSPLNAETTANGYFRYTAGNFNKFENANAVKNDLRGLGYSDAFVVGYYNGKRISLAEAMELLKKEGKTINVNAQQTAGITANSNVPQATPVPQPVQEPVAVAKELEKSNGLLYTIQVGVYARATRQGLLSLKPIFTESMDGGLFRYTAGIYNNTDRLIADKRKVVDLGIKDAFVTAYLNGKRIPFNDAKARQESDASIKMETENPIVFPENEPVTNLPVAQPATPAANASNAALADVKPFTNNVKGYPAATPENGVKQDETGICFKVQIGAYSKQVPDDVAEKFAAIKNWPVENKQINGLYAYNIGNFSEPKFAKALRDEAIRLGITDAFLTVYKDGKKLYGADATQYLNR